MTNICEPQRPISSPLETLSYAISAKKLPSGEQSVRLAEHILNNFDIPMGFIQPGKGDYTALEYTQWSSIAELTTKRYYVKIYDDQVLRGIDLISFDLDACKRASARGDNDRSHSVTLRREQSGDRKVGCSRLSYFRKPISGKPEIGGRRPGPSLLRGPTLGRAPQDDDRPYRGETAPTPISNHNASC